MAKNSDALCLKIRRLAYAQAAFAQTSAMASFLDAASDVDEQEWYAAAIAGLCTTYMRPFMEAEGIGPLPAAYGRFDDVALGEMHRDLRCGRNWIFAHHDAKNVTSLLASEEAKLFEPITVRVLPGGELLFSLSRIKFSRSRMKLVQRLCDEQIARTVKDLAGATYALVGGVVYPPGEYTLGKNLP